MEIFNMFGFIDDMISSTTKIVEGAVDVTMYTVTLGEYGELNKQNVSRLIASGLTIYALSEATGVAVDTIQKVLDN